VAVEPLRPSLTVLPRAAMLVAALAACVWLGAGLRATHLQAEADRRVAAAQVDQDEVRHKRDLLDDARFWNPDTAPLIREAQLLLFIDQDREAVRLLEDVVRREPENYEAWRGLQQAALRVDPARAREAAREAARLNPLEG
jgi:predicted Zn-dependent protease